MTTHMRTPLTDEQVEDLQGCLYEWLRIRQAHGRGPLVTAADIAKSCLLGRVYGYVMHPSALARQRLIAPVGAGKRRTAPHGARKVEYAHKRHMTRVA